MKKKKKDNPGFWIAGLEQGKFIILGPYNTEEEAYNLAMEKFSTSQFEIVELPTINMARATQLLKAGRLTDTVLIEAIQRASHQWPKDKND